MHPPGWYPDPATPGHERWWDGSSFTEELRATHVLAPPPPPPLPAYPAGAHAREASAPRAPRVARAGLLARQRDASADLASGKNTHATVALVCSLISLLGWAFGSIAGIVFGILGLRRARQYAAAGFPALGRTKSIWALGLSAVGSVVTVLAFSSSWPG